MNRPDYLDESVIKLNDYLSYPTTKDRILDIMSKASLPVEVEDWIRWTLPDGTYNTYSELRYALGL